MRLEIPLRLMFIACVFSPSKLEININNVHITNIVPGKAGEVRKLFEPCTVSLGSAQYGFTYTICFYWQFPF